MRNRAEEWITWGNDAGTRFRATMRDGMADVLQFQPAGGRLPGQVWLPVGRYFSSREILLLGEEAKIHAQAKEQNR